MMRTVRKITLHRPLWTLASLMIALVIMIPVLVIAAYWFLPSKEIWEHLVETVLAEYVINSLLLMLGVVVIAGTTGTLTAYLTATYDFAGRRVLSILLLLPLAYPGYIISFTYAGLLDYAGPVQSTLRAIFGFTSKQDYWFPDIMSLSGAIVVLSLVLYPYVFIIARPIFLTNSALLQDVARTFGCSRIKTFFKVSLPLARPAIVAGTSLALMEALNNYGTVKYYGVSTFTTGIYRAWFGLEDIPSAARLATLLMIFVFGLILLERWQRRNLVVTNTENAHRTCKPEKLSGITQTVVIILCLAPVFLGFIIPTVQLCAWAIENIERAYSAEFITLVKNSLTMALVTAAMITIFAMVLNFSARIGEGKILTISNRVATMGYAIPGSVISVGILIPLANIDNFVDSLMFDTFEISTGLLLSGSLFALGYGYTIRFLAVSYNSIDAGYSRIPQEIDSSASMLGAKPVRLLGRIHIPLIRKSLLAALLLAFIDIMKELPATLILCPFNFDTLATRTYELATEEMLPESSIYALAIVVMGLIPVLLLTKLSNENTKKFNH